MRILKILGKSILGLLVFLLTLFLLLHTPFIQKYLSRQIPVYLSDRLGTKVEMQKIGFSLFGCIEVQGLKIWDPTEELILSLDAFDLEGNFFNIMLGDFHLRKVRFEGVGGRISQSQDNVLNIQFLIDAFAGSGEPDTSSAGFKIQCDSLILSKIDFAYYSSDNQMQLSSTLEYAIATRVEFISDLLEVHIDSIRIDQHHLEMFSKTVDIPGDEGSAEEDSSSFRLDFDPGIGVEIKALTMTENSFSYHLDTIEETKKFDPNHIIVKRVDAEASDIQLLQNRIALKLRSLKAQLPQFDLDDCHAAIQMDGEHFYLADFFINAGESNINANFQADFNQDINLHPLIKLAANGNLDIADVAYFLPDTIESMFAMVSPTSFAFDLHADGDQDETISMSLLTKQSQLIASGQFSTVWAPDKIVWNNLSVRSTIGADLKTLIAPMLEGTNLPPNDIGLQMTSNGSLQEIGVDGRIKTSWGDMDIRGNVIQVSSGMDLDMNISGTRLMLGDFLNFPRLGAADFEIGVKGLVGDVQNVRVEGLISGIEVSDKLIHDTGIELYLFGDSIRTEVVVSDTNFAGRINLSGDLESPMGFSGLVQVEEFALGELLPESADRTLKISGVFEVDVTMDQSNIKSDFKGTGLTVVNSRANYTLDSLVGSALLSADSSYFVYEADDARFNLLANFDFLEFVDVASALKAQMVQTKDSIYPSNRSRQLSFNIDLTDPGLLLLMGIDIDSFSNILLEGAWEEDEQIISVEANTGLLSYSGVSYDSLNILINAKGSKLNAAIRSEDLMYDEVEIGDLAFEVVTVSDTSEAVLHIWRDSITVFNLETRIKIDSGRMALYPNALVLYNQPYEINADGPLLFTGENSIINNLNILRDDMRISLDGDLKKFNFVLSNLNLAKLDTILFSDAAVINHGWLNSKMTFVPGQYLDLDVNIDDLILLQSHPLTLDLHAETQNKEVPFDFLLSNGGSTIDIHGVYGLQQDELDANILIDIDSLEMFDLFYTNYLEYADGSIHGEANMSGPLRRPLVDGFLQFQAVDFVTRNPKLSFAVKDDRIQFSNKGLVLSDFVMFDDLNNPLYISGNILNQDYTSVAYDLRIKTDHYALINRPESAGESLKGLLVLGTDIQLKGNQKDTYVKADILIKDTTKLVLTLPDQQNQLLNTTGIIEFVDPDMLLDTTIQSKGSTGYDSLIASLPDFTLTSKLLIEEEAGLTINIDPLSGDYFKVAGKAELDLAYDRTGNATLNGTYVVTEGVYSLSFYNLVKKDFDLVKGSSVSWSGKPEDGALDIKAVYPIQSNSIGLVGHEVGDNEKSVYKKSLEYVIGIDIKGTIMKPEISFSLDLPAEDKLTYPALANKLNRLRQPEFQSELNKQVFGLLVLGSFLPETSDADGGQGDIATTALYNSVNSLLAGQLNKFAGQYIKGINIDVGLQSYSDYSSNGGKTKTSMDFHVSKSLMNDRLVFEIGGDFDIGADQSGANQGKSYRGDVAIIYDLTGNGDKQLKLFNNESYDIIYQEIRNTGISLIFIREFNKGEIKMGKKGK